MKPLAAGVILLSFLAFGSSQSPLAPLQGEKHLANLRQLTNGGENAEAYFSFDNRKLVFQSTRPPYECDQIFTMGIDGSGVHMVSTGKGRTTCGYFLPGDREIIYSSTHLGSSQCPPKPDMSRGYVWAIYPEYDIFSRGLDGSGPRPLTTTPGYDAEATVSPDGRKIVFTSVRSGDLDIYSMNVDGSEVKQLTHEKGYDGGPFYSADGQSIIYRAHHPKDPADIRRYESLLADGLIEPRSLEIMIMAADGSGRRQVTRNGQANFAPFFHPDGRRILFSSNMYDPRRRNFDLFLVNTDGTGLEQVTFNQTFDGFPMFNRSGNRLVFASNRNASREGETNIFIADWKD